MAVQHLYGRLYDRNESHNRGFRCKPDRKKHRTVIYAGLLAVICVNGRKSEAAADDYELI